MSRFHFFLACGALVSWLSAGPAAAQTLSGFDSVSYSRERLSENHWRLTGAVELEQKDTKLYADEVEIFTDQDRAVASGNVVFTQGMNRIAADRADFNTKTRLGTFYNASGIANVEPPRRSPGIGAFAPPPASSQETDVYFFGEVVEKIGAKKYKITNGGFSTCVQPTPRWDLHADTVILNIDNYTMLRNAVLNVKGVPLLYVPVLYYPTKEDGRATGILIPTYGASSLRGQAIHNAFFWAINRSQDATLMHDWYSKAGQGYGAEYRYNFGGGAEGTLSGHLLDQRPSSDAAGALVRTRAYDLRGSASQTLPGGLRARGRLDYFSSVAVNQTFNTNIYDASRSSRYFGGNVVGAWSSFSLNGTYDRSEFFQSSTSSGVVGNSPRVSLTRNEKPVTRNAPVYVSATSEFVHFDRLTKSGGSVIDDRSLARVDFSPQVRYPFKKWQWFTVNSTASWRDTYYSRSYRINADGSKALAEDNLNRRYYTLQAQAIGPVFNRIWNTPDNGYAERYKHTVEPFLNVQRTSAIDGFEQIVQIDPVDTIVGNTTNYSYGLNNRFYAKRRGTQGRPGLAQEFLSVEILQTYYTSPLASLYDTRFTTSFRGTDLTNFSPISIAARATPTPAFNTTVRAEIDSRHREFRSVTANSSYSWSNRIQTQAMWTKRFFIEDLPGFNDREALDHMLNVSTNAHTQDNRLGTTYSFNYDILRSGLVQQRLSGYYNAQCCGIAFEYQVYNYAGVISGLPADRRFFMSFTLAGLGNFSPFNGAMSGMPR